MFESLLRLFATSVIEEGSVRRALVVTALVVTMAAIVIGGFLITQFG